MIIQIVVLYMLVVIMLYTIRRATEASLNFRRNFSFENNNFRIFAAPKLCTTRKY